LTLQGETIHGFSRFHEPRGFLARVGQVQGRLLKEAAGLIELEHKIDHLPDGSKDTTDAAAGAFFNALSSAEIELLTVPQTAPGPVGVSAKTGNASPEDPIGTSPRRWMRARQKQVHHSS
jgi:hypothetical protein